MRRSGTLTMPIVSAEFSSSSLPTDDRTDDANRQQEQAERDEDVEQEEDARLNPRQDRREECTALRPSASTLQLREPDQGAQAWRALAPAAARRLRSAAAMPTLTTQICAHHPERPGIALCMSCRKVVCQECTSTWDGVNHCRPCLATRSAQLQVRSSPLSWAFWSLTMLLLLAITGELMAWSGAFMARHF